MSTRVFVLLNLVRMSGENCTLQLIDLSWITTYAKLMPNQRNVEIWWSTVESGWFPPAVMWCDLDFASWKHEREFIRTDKGSHCWKERLQQLSLSCCLVCRLLKILNDGKPLIQFSLLYMQVSIDRMLAVLSQMQTSHLFHKPFWYTYHRLKAHQCCASDACICLSIHLSIQWATYIPDSLFMCTHRHSKSFPERAVSLQEHHHPNNDTRICIAVDFMRRIL